MPHRTYHLVLGLLGLLAVVALLLARADLARQRTTGPRWKRRLVSAGLVLLGVLGLGSFGAQPGCKSSGTKPPATGGTGETGGTGATGPCADHSRYLRSTTSLSRTTIVVSCPNPIQLEKLTV